MRTREKKRRKIQKRKKKLWGVKWSRKSESLSVIEARFELKILSFWEFLGRKTHLEV